MSKEVYNTLFNDPINPTYISQLVNNTTQIPEGLARNIIDKIHTHSVPTNFMILDMGKEYKTPIILGRPFLSTTKAIIYNGTDQVKGRDGGLGGGGE